MTQYINVIGTESFFNQYERSDPGTKLSDLAHWCAVVWQDFFEDGSGDYESIWVGRAQSTVEIPNSALCGCELVAGGTHCCGLGERLGDARSWLANNYDYWDSASAVLVLDYYFGNDDGTIGTAYGDRAGTEYKVGIVDMWYEDNGEMDSGYFSNVKSEGTGQHEVCHIYGADHADGVVFSNNDTSIVCPADGDVTCMDNGYASERIRDHSSCEISEVRNYIDGCDGC